ncbi:MAG: hypothetical protein QXZ41_05795 [Ignisphaera sp.]
MTNFKRFKRNEKIKVMKILRALNYIYSLRHLESLLEIPYQSLWKYINMLSIPSDEVTANILAKLNELKLIDQTINDFMSMHKNNVHELVSDIGLLSLYALKLEDDLRDQDIDIIIPISEDSIPFATILAWELGLKMCIPFFDTKKVEDSKIRVTWYHSHYNNIELFIISTTCVDDLNVLLADTVLDDVEKLKAILHLLKSGNSKLKGVVTVYIGKDCLNFIEKHPLQSVTYYIAVI